MHLFRFNNWECTLDRPSGSPFFAAGRQPKFTCWSSFVWSIPASISRSISTSYPYNLNNKSHSTLPLQVAWVGAVVADYLYSCLSKLPLSIARVLRKYVPRSLFFCIQKNEDSLRFSPGRSTGHGTYCQCG